MGFLLSHTLPIIMKTHLIVIYTYAIMLYSTHTNIISFRQFPSIDLLPSQLHHIRK